MDKNDHTAPQTLVSTPTKQLPHTCTQGWRSVNNNLFLFLKHKHQSLNSIFCLTNASKHIVLQANDSKTPVNVVSFP